MIIKGTSNIGSSPSGSGGGGGKQLYQHNIMLSNSNTSKVGIQIINDNPNVMTFANVKDWLNDNGFNSWNKIFIANGVYISNGTIYNALYVYYNNGDLKCGYQLDANNSVTGTLTSILSGWGDTVIPL